MAERGYISSAWANLPEVIVSLLDDLDRKQLKPPNDVHSGGPENGRASDEGSRRSKVLRLNAFPTRIWRRDAYLAFRTMIDVITALEPIDPTRMDFSNWGYHSFKGEDLLLPEIARRLDVPDDA